MAGFEPAHTRVKVLCLNRLATPHRCPSEKKWGGRRDSNPRPSEPQSDILTRLNYAHHICFFRMNPHTHALAGFPPGERCVLGASAGIRTLDLRLRRPLLYPAELQALTDVVIPLTVINYIIFCINCPRVYRHLTASHSHLTVASSHTRLPFSLYDRQYNTRLSTLLDL